MTSDPNPKSIPEPVQQVVHEFADRAEHFVNAARDGGSWVDLYTWLMAMKPRFTMLVDIGLQGIDGAARMAISPERQEELMAGFTVPDTVPETPEEDEDE